MNEPQRRLQVVFADLRRAVDDVILKHQVTLDELLGAIDWLRQVADAGELPSASILFYKTVLKATAGATYAHPEKDGASHWEMEGPAHRPGAPVLHSPAVLPMRPDEPGEPLIVSGTVRTTTGDPLPGAALEIWQIDADNVYSGMDTSDFGPLNIPNDSTGIPADNLRARIIADSDGRYEFRTVMPGVETFGLATESPLGALTQALQLEGLRPLHIHSIVSAEGCLPLTTQIYFDGDPLVESTIEGAVPAEAVKTTTRHEDHHARGMDRPYRALTYDFVLRPEQKPVP
ncbi:catechol 1,2-dioxygenase [Amycolatopsis balhimycina DSM 5908]|uniref:Catechol 1,2-dioxygenase n=1 Tax=Amycolatopsis balhimycina DSM 5908 TaxID=1081091 RepID=A0A428X682_AMYBA|nr:catechol 1,2-dioxygenase [Amycolatopsis balhimycina]RSM50843.1 catechol 1,2-dioxygenase [Amycolatopsis balhimycina DSM 5908]